MKLKNIKGLLPKEKGYWDIQVKANGTIYGVGDVYNSARKEFSEKEIELDIRKVENIIRHSFFEEEEEKNPNKNFSNGGWLIEEEAQVVGIADRIAQALAKADIIKAKGE